MEPYFSGFGITGAQWAVLHTLYRTSEDGLAELRMAELGERLLIRPPSVTSVVKRLQQMKLIEGHASEADHRARFVSLTTAGRAMVARVLAKHEQQVQLVFGCFAPPDQAALAASLDRLSNHLAEQLDTAVAR